MRYSISRILLLASILVAFIGAVLIIGASFSFYQFNFNQAVNEKTNTLKILSDSIAGPLLTFREPTHPLVIENILQKAVETPGILFVRSFDDKRKIVVLSSDSKETGIKIEDSPLFKRDIGVRDGFFKGERIKEFSIKARDGTNLWMGLSLKDTKRNILVNAIVLGAIVALLIILTALMMFFIFRRVLIIPLISLIKAFEGLQKGDYRVRLNDSPVIEIQKV